MMIKKICTIDKIKKELDIDFDNLELVGSYKMARNNKISAIYKNHNNFFIFTVIFFCPVIQFLNSHYNYHLSFTIISISYSIEKVN